jgi:hypothetical protein
MFFALLLAAAVASPGPTASPAPSPSPTPGLIPTFAPSVVATATPVYNFVYRPSPAPDAPAPLPGAPLILEVDVNDQTIAAPGPLHVRILTSDSIVSVAGEAYGYEVEIPRHGNGLFIFDGMIPEIPDAVKGKQFFVDVVGSTKDGRTTTITLPFMLK